MKNDIHEPGNGRDRAKSLAKNIIFNKEVIDNNPYFNHTLDEIPETKYLVKDLVQMGQVCQIEHSNQMNK